jgi:hypothetical protein
MGRIIYEEARDIKPEEWEMLENVLSSTNYNDVVTFLREVENKPIPSDELFPPESIGNAKSAIQTRLRLKKIPFTLSVIGSYWNNDKRNKFPLAFTRVKRKK